MRSVKILLTLGAILFFKSPPAHPNKKRNTYGIGLGLDWDWIGIGLGLDWIGLDWIGLSRHD